MTTTEIDDVSRIVPYPIEKHRDGGVPYFSREIRIRCRDGYTLIRLRATLAAELRMPGDDEPASPVPITRDANGAAVSSSLPAMAFHGFELEPDDRFSLTPAGESLLSPQAKATLDQVRREWATEDAAREPDPDDEDEDSTLDLPEPNGLVDVEDGLHAQYMEDLAGRR